MDFDILAALEDRSIEVETLADKDRMQIEYINVKDIIPARNDNNFYDTDDVITLKESIRVEGVKQNLIVKKKNNEGKYELIAGERRWKACKSLYEEGIKDFEYIPCVINKYEDDLKDRLSLITTNCTARKLTDWERTEQVEALNNILKEYKQRGIKLPAPRKDLISKLINESKTNVARMLGLKNNLIGIFKDAMKNGMIGLSVAYELSTLPQDKQELMINQFKENGGLTLNNVKYIKDSLKNEVEDEHIQDEDKPIEICKTDNVNIYDKQKEDILLEYLRYFENKLKYYTELHSMAENEQDNDVLQSSLKAIEYTSELIEKVQSDLFALTDDEKYDIEDNKEN